MRDREILSVLDADLDCRLFPAIPLATRAATSLDRCFSLFKLPLSFHLKVFGEPGAIDEVSGPLTQDKRVSES